MAKRRSREAMVVVSSFSPADGAVALKPDAAALGLAPGWVASDAETGEAVPVAGGVAKVDVPAYGFRIVRLAAK